MIGSVLRVRYEVTQAVGENPIFTSYAAKDRITSKDVCVRVLKQPMGQEPEFIIALGSVVRSLAHVEHPSIERPLEVDGDEGIPFLVTELTPGPTLEERIRKLGTFSVPVTVALGISICEGLQALQSSGHSHGDLSPLNVVMVSESQARLQLPSIWEAFSSSSTAGALMLPLMAPYLAPEISRGSMPTPTSDVYSVGVMLYEMLCGRPPYSGETPVSLALKHATEAVPDARTLNPSVPTVLNEIIKKAMSKELNGRYRNASELLTDLRILQDALRFGRSLTWPLSPATAPVEAPRVTPKITTAAPAAAKSVAVEDESDVPLWMKMAIAFFAGLVMLMVIGWIVFNMNKPGQVSVPELKRLSIAEASASLEKAGLKIRVAGRESNEQVPAEHVLETDPPAGERVYQSSTVAVTLSTGSRFVEVPDVRGMSVEKARALLASLKLELDDRVEEVRDRNVDPGMIVSQVPGPREKHERYTRVRVKVSGDRTEGDRDASRKFLYTVRIRLTDVEEHVDVRVDVTDARGTKTVHDEPHDAGEEFSVDAEGYGNEVTFRIFYDGELVKTVVKGADEE